MRPDEHKKKKNTQYKKKHGISEKENKQKDDQKSKTNVQDQKSKHTNAKGAESADAQHSDKTKSKVKLEETEEVNKHYGRRKIESNWSRYEEDSDSEVEDDIPLQRGEDFNKLLAQAGGSATQFRLRDEEEWNDESGDSAPALALDLDSLSQSLDCIPLHERLGIKENLFTEEQINEIKEYSANVEQKYGTSINRTINQNKSKKTGSDITSTVSSAIENNITDKTIDNKANNTHTTNVKAKPKTPETKKLKKDANEHKKPVRNLEVESLEDDLDMILSLDDTKDKSVSIVNKVEKVAHNSQRKNLEKGTSNVMKISDKEKEKVNESKGNENLEDWLDSMLDD